MKFQVDKNGFIGLSLQTYIYKMLTVCADRVVHHNIFFVEFNIHFRHSIKYNNLQFNKIVSSKEEKVHEH